MSLEPQTAASSSRPDVVETASSPGTTPVKPRRSRWVRYSLRALLLSQVVLAAFVGYVVWRVRLIERQHAAALEIEEHNPRGPSYKTRPVSPAWFWEPVCHFCGSPQASDVIDIMSQRHPLTIKEVQGLPYLESLAISRGIDNEEVMTVIAKSKCLEKLYIMSDFSNSITDSALARISNNSSVETLSIEGRQITDFGIGALSEMPNLTSLTIYQTSATARALDQWIEKNRLHGLSVHYPLTTHDIRRLARLTTLQRLQVLSLEEDAAMALAPLQNLEKILLIDPHSMTKLSAISNHLPVNIQLIDFQGKPVRRTP